MHSCKQLTQNGSVVLAKVLLIFSIIVINIKIILKWEYLFFLLNFLYLNKIFFINFN